MLDEDVAPDPQLMESMRAVGYTLETAIADIIDNAITAGGHQVDLRFTATPEPRIAIIDNGSGMTVTPSCARCSSPGRLPSVQREPYHLGPFRPRIETASLSQARSLTSSDQARGSLAGGPVGSRSSKGNRPMVSASA